MKEVPYNLPWANGDLDLLGFLDYCTVRPGDGGGCSDGRPEEAKAGLGGDVDAE